MKHKVSTICGKTTTKGTNRLVDGHVSVAILNKPSGVCIDHEGNILFTDRENHAVRKIVNESTVVTLAGNGYAGFIDGPAKESLFNFPSGICVDAIGNILVCDCANHVIRKIDCDGMVTTIAGSTKGFKNGVGVDTRFNYPRGICVEKNGDILVSDMNNNAIRRIDTEMNVHTVLSGKFETFVDATITTETFFGPSGICIDNDGSIFVVDRGHHTLRKLDSNGKNTVVAPKVRKRLIFDVDSTIDSDFYTTRFQSPIFLAIDDENNILLTDFENSLIRILNLGQETVRTLIMEEEGSEYELIMPSGICIDSDGNIIVAEYGNNQIKKIEWALSLSGKNKKYLQQLKDEMIELDLYPYRTNEVNEDFFWKARTGCYFDYNIIQNKITFDVITEYVYGNIIPTNIHDTLEVNDYFEIYNIAMELNLAHLVYLLEESINSKIDDFSDFIKEVEKRKINFNEKGIKNHSEHELFGITNEIPQSYFENDIAKIFDERQYPDVTLSIEDIFGNSKEFKCHKKIICHKSEYFEAMFRHIPNKDENIVHHDSLLPISAFTVLMNYWYFQLSPDISLIDSVFILTYGDSYLTSDHYQLTRHIIINFSNKIIDQFVLFTEFLENLPEDMQDTILANDHIIKCLSGLNIPVNVPGIIPLNV